MFGKGTNERLRPACLSLADYTPEQEVSSVGAATAFRNENQEGFPEFSQQIDSELVSAEDETISVATNISEEQQLMLFNVDDDIFTEEIVIAEEVFADEIMLKPKKTCKELKQQVNVVSATLNDLIVVVSSLNNASQGAGYITKIAVQQSFKRELDDIYAAINSQESHDFIGNAVVNNGKTTVNFQFYSLPDGQPPSIKVQIEGFRATLDDTILMHLSAFIYDDQKTSVPSNLKINLVDTQITVRDPKTKSFRIKLNDCVIEQTEDDENIYDSS
ncbi:hypothetical protein LOAG_01626 [Loa loa]|uniref:PITH domain-containing protein n=1 Tax=Loa loa TaxID=7209 RepID=A0A1I7W4G0_LOALO|nr:hypothetical protein LOAG_01626 [Loa loa]EFO26856.1 hypothetical protein LOAG_01626 [Loa loa]